VNRGRIERLVHPSRIRAIMAQPRRVRMTDSSSRPPDRPRPARPQFYRCRAKPDLARRYRLHRADQEWLYLSTIDGPVPPQDRWLGMRDHLLAELPLAALSMAISAQRPGPSLIHHSDRGVQYAWRTTTT
jgi:putative transposase